MPQPQMEQRSLRDQQRGMIDITFGFALAGAMCSLVLLRKDFGRRAFQPALFSIPIMWVYAGFNNCPLLIYYIPLWLVLVFLHRLSHARDQLSTFLGVSSWFRWAGSLNAQDMMEVFACFAGAVLAEMYYPPLTAFMLFQTLCLVIVIMTGRMVREAQSINIRDAEILARSTNRYR